MVPYTRLRAAAGVAILGCGLTACAELPQDEYAWQALHAVDVAQTRQIALSDCFREANPATVSLIGEHPSTGGVLAWGAATSALHAGLSVLLERYDAPRWMKATWKAVSFGTTGYAVAHNFHTGIGVDSADCR